jgi:hypothetical protein
MQFFPMGLQAREIGEWTIVWFDGVTKSVDIGPTRRPLFRRAHFRSGGVRLP